MPTPTRTSRILILALASLAASCSTGGGTRHLEAKGALGPYSAGVVSGDFCFLAGQIGSDKSSFEAEVSSALDKVERELARAGCTLADVVQATVYLVDMNAYATFNGIYGKRLPPPYPARTCVAVRALPGGARAEIQVVARRPR